MHTVLARARSGTGLLLIAGLLAGCAPDRLLGSKELPPDVSDPGQTKTSDGALAAYRGALAMLKNALGGDDLYSFVPLSGLLSDELQSSEIGLIGASDIQGYMAVDRRALPEYKDPGMDQNMDYRKTYGILQQVRGQAREARGGLAKYAPEAPHALAGHLYAIEAYADVLLADLFCSGIPLSTLDFEGDYTYQPGSSTQEVYQHAVALFDSALALTADSVRILNLAHIGKGRALLALGQYAEAAEAVADVQDDYRYEIPYSTVVNPDPTGFGRSSYNFAIAENFTSGATLGDREGGNGLDYLSSSDPRTRGIAAGTGTHGYPLYAPAKYAPTGDSPIVLADGVEARLIQAEAALQSGDPSWLATLNALRTDGTFSTQPNAADSTKTDTLWNAGSGGTAGLAPLDDPGTPAARIDLLFRERAFWLFLTGHRQGDLRRLIRQYGRNPQSVYPTGGYLGANGAYGSDVTVPVPAAEGAYNPKFTGCISRGA